MTQAPSAQMEKNLFSRKKKPFKGNKNSNKNNQSFNQVKNPRFKKKNFARKFVEQQATKSFIKKDDKPTGKSKLKLKSPIDKRDFKLTVSEL